MNDVNAILVGEASFGSARGARDALAVYFGTGIGGALMVGGSLVVGAGGNAGEIGHVKVPGFEGTCGCGEVGCVEALAGGAALDRRIARTPGWEGLGVGDVDGLATAGDPAAVALWEEVASAAGDIVSGACTLLNPSTLILGGGVLDRTPACEAVRPGSIPGRAD